VNSKDKAKELYNDAYMRWCYELSHDKNHLTAKDIAIYVCNEILQNCYEVMKPFWEEVKQEIQLL
jgi:hypothetical protein